MEASLQPLTFFVGPENPLYLQFQLELDLITAARKGGVLAEQRDEDMEEMYEVLDLACGSGVWAQEVALTYPEMAVCGIDPSSTLIRHAQSHARRLGLENLRFEVMDVTHLPLCLPDASFDLLNGKLLSRTLLPDTWPAFLAECIRLLRPGGILRLTEGDWSIVHESAPALAHVLAWCQAIPGFEQPLSTRLLQAMRESGFREIQCYAQAIDISLGTPAHAGFRACVECLYQLKRSLGQPKPDLDALFQEALSEMNREHFSAVISLLTLWGKKPPQAKSHDA